MSLGEFTASNINMEEDKREEEANRKKSTLDMEKLKADIAALKGIVAQGHLAEALEGLLNLEKSSRQAEDITACKECCRAVLETCFEARDWKTLQENVVVVSKRRGQMKQVVQAVVRQAMGYIEHTPDKATKVELIKTLQSVTEGKIYVEIERARLTKRLAAMKELDGEVAEAADILQEVAVETFGAMAKTEKIAFILEQVRLCLDKQDYIRAQILSRKISPKAFVERKGEGQGEIGIEGSTIEAPDEGVPGLEDLKLMYYQLMIRYHSHFNNYLEICRCYRSISEVPKVAEDTERWSEVVQKICWYLVLAPAYSTSEGSSSDRLTLLTTTLQDKRLADMPKYKQLLHTFTTHEIISRSSLESDYQEEISAMAEVFGGEQGPARLKDLRLRVIEYNILVVAMYYTNIKMARLAELLDLDLDETEQQLSNLVVAKAVAARIDRPLGVVVFGRKQKPDEILNAWANNISKLLDLVEKSCQQIQKEAMVHQVTLGTQA